MGVCPSLPGGALPQVSQSIRQFLVQVGMFWV